MESAGEKARGFGDILKGILAADAIKAGARAIVNFTKQAVQAYADYEQLVGGVQTLFGLGGQSLDEYAKAQGKAVEAVKKEWLDLTTAERVVLNNADKAYKTAGLSANAYMETVTSFSASLLQSLGNDTKKAAKYADRAIVDMADNANKMGSSMESIQNAYQGFAKQNYTMLDNLKLGYGGTKTEMERLIKDAEKIDKSFKASRDSNGDLAMSYAEIVDAIHIVQDEMGITGTTSKEASETISGSIASAKAAFENFVAGLADDNADVEELTQNLFDSVETAANNLLPVVKKVGIAMFEILFSEENIAKFTTGAMDLIYGILSGLVGASESDKAQSKAFSAGRNIAVGIGKGIKQSFEDVDWWGLILDIIKGGATTNTMAEIFGTGNASKMTGGTGTAGYGTTTVPSSKSTSGSSNKEVVAAINNAGKQIANAKVTIDGDTVAGYVDTSLGNKAASAKRYAFG